MNEEKSQTSEETITENIEDITEYSEEESYQHPLRKPGVLFVLLAFMIYIVVSMIGAICRDIPPDKETLIQREITVKRVIFDDDAFYFTSDSTTYKFKTVNYTAEELYEDDIIVSGDKLLIEYYEPRYFWQKDLKYNFAIACRSEDKVYQTREEYMDHTKQQLGIDFVGAFILGGFVAAGFVGIFAIRKKQWKHFDNFMQESRERTSQRRKEKKEKRQNVEDVNQQDN